MEDITKHEDKDILIDQFQYLVDDLFVRNKSLLDAITKYQESNSRVNRNISKAVTQCGCIKLEGKKQNFSDEMDFEESKKALSSQIKGKICNECRDSIEKEIGRNFFYLAVICNDLGINLYDVIRGEFKRLESLGNYSLR